MLKIKELRNKIGISQNELAKQLDVVQSTVSMWENGTNSPKTSMIPKLAEILQCSIDELF